MGQDEVTYLFSLTDLSMSRIIASYSTHTYTHSFIYSFGRMM